MPLHTWLVSSHHRQFPHTPSQSNQSLHIEAALNERFSFQAVVRMEGEERQRLHIEAAGPSGWRIRVRRVGYVPMPHHNRPVLDEPLDMDGLGHVPGFVPDPLFEEDSLLLQPGETHAFWISVEPGNRAEPGEHAITVTLHPEHGETAVLRARVALFDVKLKKRRGFQITHWFYADALMDWYRTGLFGKAFWDILPAYLQNMTSHGQDTLYVPAFTPPLDGVKRPTQLVRVKRTAPGEYRFDWRDVRQYIDLAKRAGFTHFEWTHPFTQWGARHAIRIYEGQGADEKLLWKPETGATSKTYRTFLSQYLPALHRFLSEEKLLKHSFFHVSDEPHQEEDFVNYRKARGMLRELAPWMQVMDALTKIELARDCGTDMPIPSLTTALDFLKEGIPSWCYYCCCPSGRYLNRFLDTPLAKIGMHGLVFYRWPFHGFLQWGYNYWYQSQTRTLIDPFTVSDAGFWEKGWMYGDTFLVYPGSTGPIDSIRWEVFAESMQDYALLQTLGVNRGHAALAPIENFQDFPKTEAWRQAFRAKALRGELA